MREPGQVKSLAAPVILLQEQQFWEKQNLGDSQVALAVQDI